MMGSEARAAAARKLQEVVFDFTKPPHRIMRADKFMLSREPDGKEVRLADGTLDMGRITSRATCALIVEIVGVAFAQTRMRPREGDDYESWLEAMQTIEEPYDGPDPDMTAAGVEMLEKYQAVVTVGDVEWLLKHLKNEDLGVQPGMVQWRKAVRLYCEGLVREEPARALPHADREA